MTVNFNKRVWYDQTTDQILPQSKRNKTDYAERHIPLRKTLEGPFLSPESLRGNQVPYVQKLSQEVLGVALNSPLMRYNSAPVNYSLKPKKIFPLPLSQQACKIYDASIANKDYYTDLLDWSIADISTSALVVPLVKDNNMEVLIAFMHGCERESEMNFVCELPDTTSLRLRKSSKELIVGQNNGSVRVFDTETTQETGSTKGKGGLSSRVGTLASHPDESLILAGSHDHKIRLIDLRKPQAIVKEFRGHHSEICSLQWSKVANCFASGGNDKQFKVWDIRSSEQSCMFGDLIDSPVRAQGFSPKQPSLLANGGGGVKDHILRIWDIAKQKLVTEIDAKSQVTNLFWSPDGQYIATTHGSFAQNINVWQLDNSELHLINELPSQPGAIIQAAQSPDGQYIAASVDDTLQIWDIFKPKIASTHKVEDPFWSKLR